MLNLSANTSVYRRESAKNPSAIAALDQPKLRKDFSKPAQPVHAHPG